MKCAEERKLFKTRAGKLWISKKFLTFLFRQDKAHRMNDCPSIELLKFSATLMDNFKFCIKRVIVHDDNERNAQLLLLFDTFRYSKAMSKLLLFFDTSCYYNFDEYDDNDRNAQLLLFIDRFRYTRPQGLKGDVAIAIIF